MKSLDSRSDLPPLWFKLGVINSRFDLIFLIYIFFSVHRTTPTIDCNRSEQEKDQRLCNKMMVHNSLSEKAYSV